MDAVDAADTGYLSRKLQHPISAVEWLINARADTGQMGGICSCLGRWLQLPHYSVKNVSGQHLKRKGTCRVVWVAAAGSS